MRAVVCGVLLFVAAGGSACAQDAETYSRKNTFSLFVEGGKPSTPILMGADKRRLLFGVGGGYARRLFQFRDSSLSYQVEVRPAIFESDPVEIVGVTEIGEIGTTTVSTGVSERTGEQAIYGPCQPSVSTYSFPTTMPTYTITQTVGCGREWTFGQVFSPIGFKYSLRTRHAVQPFVIGTLGYMYTTRPVPVEDAEAFNFSFDLGVGLEVFRSAKNKKSLAVECRYHHFSNRNTAEANPGTDNLMFKLTYNFGR